MASTPGFNPWGPGSIPGVGDENTVPAPIDGALKKEPLLINWRKI